MKHDYELYTSILILGSIFYEVDKKKAEKRRKGKEASAQAKKELHQPIGKGPPLCGGTIPAYPLGGYRPGHKY